MQCRSVQAAQPIVQTHRSNSRCANEPQEPEPETAGVVAAGVIDPASAALVEAEISLDGQNCACCELDKKLPTKNCDLNSNIECLKYEELCDFITTPVPFPAYIPGRLAYTLNPPLNVPSCQKVVYPPTPAENQRLPINNRIVLVVGGSKGLGKAIAEYLSGQGFTVIATSRHPHCYDALPANANYKLSSVPLDIRSEDSVKNFFKRIVRPLGKLNAVLNLPGLHWFGPLSGATAQDYENAIQLKVVGYHRVAYYAIPYLRVEPNGRLISFSSIAGGESYISLFQGAYNVSNHAISMWNDNLMVEERILYATNAIENPITFTAVQPQVINSTIGLHQNYIATDPDLKVYTDAAHLFIATAQSGGGQPLGILTDSQAFVAEQIFDILVAIQPGVRYILGNPDGGVYITIPGVPTPILLSWATIVGIYNEASPDAVIAEIIGRTATPTLPATPPGGSIAEQLYNPGSIGDYQFYLKSLYCGTPAATVAGKQKNAIKGNAFDSLARHFQ